MSLAIRLGIALALVVAPVTAAAQTDPGEEVVIRGSRAQPSDWREAETDHVVVVSDGGERELVRIAHNLEKLHFLLCGLFGRTDEPDDTRKLRVTLVGDAAEFEAMQLRNLRAQPGPFAPAFAVQRYYDPREDGAVLASTRHDQRAAIVRGVRLDSLAQVIAAVTPPLSGEPEGRAPTSAPSTQTASFGSDDPLAISVNAEEVPVSAEGRIYAGYAQHFLLTYYPAAYPRWYVDGFGEVFATLVAREDGVLEFGRPPEGVHKVLDQYRMPPVASPLRGKAIRRDDFAARWTPFHAWALTHLLMFSDARRPQLRAYLRAIAEGQPAAQATAAFGDLGQLDAALAGYVRHKLPYDRMTYPAERTGPPIVRRLTKGQAAFVKGRIELGSRVEIPPAPPTDADAKRAERMAQVRRIAIAARDRWLKELREDTARFPRDPQAQLLLAEAECRSGNADPCAAAADRALAAAPGNADALAWKGMALVQTALAAPPAERAARLKAARATIVRANRLDLDNPLPLIVYYRSFADAGETASDAAVTGLRKVVDTVPAAPGPRLLLGAALARRGEAEAARAVLWPVAEGAYDSPERAEAQALLAGG